MEKNYTICVSYNTIGELLELLNDLPQTGLVSCCGEMEFYINVCEGGNIIIDTVEVV